MLFISAYEIGAPEALVLFGVLLLAFGLPVIGAYKGAEARGKSEARAALDAIFTSGLILTGQFWLLLLKWLAESPQRNSKPRD